MSDDAALMAALRDAVQTARPAGDAPFTFAVAVSGGGDSMALLHLAHRLCRESVYPVTVSPKAPGESVYPVTVCADLGGQTVSPVTLPGLRLEAVTVDHALRPESAAEALGVAEFCAALGIPHSILRWSEGPKPQGNLMDQARHARAALMADWAKARGISHIFLGHTADDVAETFLMNLARSAGLEGLSGLRPRWSEGGVTWARPLLSAPRESLRAYLRRQGVAWVDDPSNDNPRFARVRARQALKSLKPLGISPEALAESARHLATARAALQAELAAHISAQVTEIAGSLTFTPADFPPEMLRLLLGQAILWMTGAAHTPRADKISQAISRICAGESCTLAGLRLRAKGPSVTLTREPRATMGPVPMGQIWDHRWHITGPITGLMAPNLTIAALGPHGLAQCPDWRPFGPRDALLVAPAIWQENQLVAAPLARSRAEWAASVQPSFGMFVLRH
ncbi:tRNA lysidine(34) synthetase TilS [Gemmobacter sp.]|uniref:tRNA lysidine(34) synthetase TilS n=1 Tax=Gemmobacter sp. TaxID=1898957 RepID=UPI0025BE76EE|nr:tRNA lysidine(34) synthetase TilS [Gemmobacter sp.]